MFARWVKSGVVRRRAGVRSAGRPSGAALLESLSSSFFFCILWRLISNYDSARI